MNQFDLISDIHLDFWVEKNKTAEQKQEKIKEIVEYLVPKEPSKVLVIAGDLGHHNEQNIKMLEELKKYYKYITFTWGNHDLYLVSSKERWKYERRSIRRWKEMKSLASTLENVYPLDGTSVTIEGVTFGGTGMWYDYSFGMKEFGKSRGEMHELWEDVMNDGLYIKGLPKFEEEKGKLNAVFSDLDVVVTHVGPDYSNLILDRQMDLCNSFYYFDGSEFLEKAQNKVWCFGHTHNHYAYYKNGCYLVNNALGYPKERPDMLKIAQIGL